MDNYYIYRHIRLDTNEVFYVGMGKNRRYKDKTGRNNLWNRIFKKCKGNIYCEKILEELSFEEAISKEIEFIALYGRKDLGTGTLANLTDGGEGTKSLSKEIIDKIKLSKIGKKASEETKKKLSEIRKGSKRSDETKRKMSDSMRGEKNHRFGKKNSEEMRSKISKSVNGEKNGNYKGIIYCLDIETGEIIKSFLNPKEIKEFLGLNMNCNLSHVYAALSGKREHSYGYKWKR